MSSLQTTIWKRSVIFIQERTFLEHTAQKLERKNLILPENKTHLCLCLKNINWLIQ